MYLQFNNFHNESNIILYLKEVIKAFSYILLQVIFIHLSLYLTIQQSFNYFLLIK